jgi:aldehyde dehydrogenase (NAD+)
MPFRRGHTRPRRQGQPSCASLQTFSSEKLRFLANLRRSLWACASYLDSFPLLFTHRSPQTCRPITTFRAMTDRSVAGIHHSAALALNHLGDASPSGTPGYFNVSIKQPYGVVAGAPVLLYSPTILIYKISRCHEGIIPWNASIMLLCLKVAPAVAAGNTIVIKTSEKSPLASAHVGKLINEAGFPPGVVNIIAGLGHIAGQGKHKIVSFFWKARETYMLRLVAAGNV